MDDQVQAALASLPAQGDVVEQARKAMAHLAQHGVPELACVANELKLSPRMLYRQLAARGHQFRNLRETTLRQSALAHVQEGRLPISDIAQLLGYSEQSAFTRAFKRWTGQSPLQWRKSRQTQAALR